MSRIVLASASPIRRLLLERAGVAVDVRPARIDEAAVRASLQSDGAGARDQADALAELKSLRAPGAPEGSLVVGCDQVLESGGEVLSKPGSREAARDQLLSLGGCQHRLHSAAVISEDGRPVWRQIQTARMTMRPLSSSFVEAYLGRNWPAVSGCVGAYMVEEEGVRLFSAIDGDWFAVLGLPLLPLLNFLADRGLLDS